MSQAPAIARSLNERGVGAAWGHRWLLPSLCALLFMGLALGNPNYRWSERRDVPYGADFLQEWTAGDMLLHGAADSIYDADRFAKWQHDSSRVGFEWPDDQYYPAVYPPPYYCLVAPLAALPYRVATLVWLATMLAAYPLSVWLIERRPWACNSSDASVTAKTYGYSRVALLFPALFMSLVMGQKGTLWMLIAVASWQVWRAERRFTAGCVWALLTVKPTLCCWLPLVMLANRQWRFCGGVLVGALVLWGATAAMVPTSLWSDFCSVILSSGSYQEHVGYRDGWSASMLTMFTALGLPHACALVLWTIAGAAVLLSLMALPRGVPAEVKLARPEFMLRVLIATALLSPHFYYYDLVWLLYPLGGLFASSPRRAVGYTATLWLSMLLAQQFESGWPVISLVLLGIFAHSTVALLSRRK